MPKKKTTRILLAALAVLIVVALLVGLFVMMAGMTLFSSAAEQKRRQDAMNSGSMCAAPMISADGKFANPMVGPITSPFGPRPNPFGPGVLPPGFTSEEQLTFHYGADIGRVSTGTPFYAAASGVVEGAEIGGSDGGNAIRIRGDDGNMWVYLHAADGTTVVKQGQRVEAGDRLAGAGETGAAKGVHLHLAVKQGPEEKPIDPVAYLAAQGVTLGQGGPTPVESAKKVGASSPPASEKSVSADAPLMPGGGTLRVPLPSGQTLPLLPEQQRNASVIIGVGREMQLSDQAIIIALMTAFQESSLLNLASPAVPESLNYPHDRLGVNKASVGLFQQQHTMGWGTVQDLMNPELSTRTFFEGHDNPGAAPALGLLDLPGWESMSPGVAAQTVQISSFPDEYHKWENTARFLLENIAGADVAQCHSGPVKEGEETDPEAPNDQKESSGEGSDTVTVPEGTTRESIVTAARSGVGGEYKWGSAEFKSWDASGLVAWVYQDQGVQVPRTAPWTVGTRTESPQPGDLVAQDWNPDRNRWEHVGVYVGQGRMVSAVNESTGTREHPVTQTGSDPVYFDILGGQ